jgi:hypothetical protein
VGSEVEIKKGNKLFCLFSLMGCMLVISVRVLAEGTAMKLGSAVLDAVIDLVTLYIMTKIGNSLYILDYE